MQHFAKRIIFKSALWKFMSNKSQSLTLELINNPSVLFIYECLLVCTFVRLFIYLPIRYLFVYVSMESAYEMCDMT